MHHRPFISWPLMALLPQGSSLPLDSLSMITGEGDAYMIIAGPDGGKPPAGNRLYAESAIAQGANFCSMMQRCFSAIGQSLFNCRGSGGHREWWASSEAEASFWRSNHPHEENAQQVPADNSRRCDSLPALQVPSSSGTSSSQPAAVDAAPDAHAQGTNQMDNPAAEHHSWARVVHAGSHGLSDASPAALDATPAHDLVTKCETAAPALAVDSPVPALLSRSSPSFQSSSCHQQPGATTVQQTGGLPDLHGPHPPSSSIVLGFPRRPDQPLCDFFSRTGHCKFGEGCKFDHPPKFAVCLNERGLPLRPGQPICSFYSRTGACKFGPSCKFDHPS